MLKIARNLVDYEAGKKQSLITARGIIQNHIVNQTIQLF
jgi:hypothetical protein